MAAPFLNRHAFTVAVTISFGLVFVGTVRYERLIREEKQ